LTRATDRAQVAGDTCEDRMASGEYDAEEFDQAELLAWEAEQAAQAAAAGKPITSGDTTDGHPSEEDHLEQSPETGHFPHDA
jgi:hypothetical protein